MRKIFFAITLLCALPSEAALQVDRVMADMMVAWKIPGAAVAVVKDDKVVFLKGYGVKEIGGAPVTADTLFQIASASKAFTTTAMAILVDEKKMSWDDPLRKHLDYFRLADPCADSFLNLRDIVSHRSGLAGHDELWDYTDLSRDDVLRRVASIEMDHPFRSAYRYNNIMFTAAGEAVAAASGFTYEQFLDERVFEPLGMKSTVITEAEWQRADHALGHYYDAEAGVVKPQTMHPYTNLGGAGLIKSNARDMAQWLRFHLANGVIDGRRIVSEAALNETKQPHTILRLEGATKERHPETNLYTYGLGWWIQDYRGELLVFHSGSLNGFRTQVALLPEQNAGVVVMVNAGRANAAVAARNGILDQIIGKGTRDWNAYLSDLENKGDQESAKRRAEREAKRFRDTKPSRELAAYAGTYGSPAYGNATVSLDGERLMLSWGRLRVPLAHWHFDTFRAVDDSEGLDEQVTFGLGPDGNVKTMTLFGQSLSRLAGEGGVPRSGTG